MSARQKIRIRTYDAGYGSCFLAFLPGRERTRTLLVDPGSAVSPDVSNETAKSILDDIAEQCDGNLDVVVVSGEHGSHLSGLFRGRGLFRRCPVSNVWMGMSSHPDYYDEYPQADTHRLLRDFSDAFSNLAARRGVSAPAIKRLVESSGSHARGLAYARAELGETTWFVARGADMHGTGLGDVKTTILAPEIDVSRYYGESGAPLAATVHALAAKADRRARPQGAAAARGSSKRGRPPFLSASAWRRLQETSVPGGVRALRAYCRARDDASLVFMVEVAGKRLLFLGDAGHESWECMERSRKLRPVDFLGAGDWSTYDAARARFLDAVLPKSRKSRAKSVVSAAGKAALADLELRAGVHLAKAAGNRTWFDVSI